MVRVSWLGQMSTSIPVTFSQVCTWAVTAQPQLVHRFSGTSRRRPTAAELEQFNSQNRHFGEALVFLYAQEYGLFPASATRPRS